MAVEGKESVRRLVLWGVPLMTAEEKAAPHILLQSPSYHNADELVTYWRYLWEGGAQRAAL